MPFIDYESKYNKVIIAITKVENSFIIFGNIRVFIPTSVTLSGNLTKIIFKKKYFK